MAANVRRGAFIELARRSIWISAGVGLGLATIGIARVRHLADITNIAIVGEGALIGLLADVVVTVVQRGANVRISGAIVRATKAASAGRLWGCQATDKYPAAYDGLHDLPEEFPARLWGRRTIDHAVF
jgi:hypothetical protein